MNKCFHHTPEFTECENTNSTLEFHGQSLLLGNNARFLQLPLCASCCKFCMLVYLIVDIDAQRVPAVDHPLPNHCMATSSINGTKACRGAGGDESGPGQAVGRWAVMEADIWGLRRPEPPRLGRLGPLRRPARMACCADGLIGWSDPGTLPIREDREIRLAMSDYSRA